MMKFLIGLEIYLFLCVSAVCLGIIVSKMDFPIAVLICQLCLYIVMIVITIILRKRMVKLENDNSILVDEVARNLKEGDITNIQEMFEFLKNLYDVEKSDDNWLILKNNNVTLCFEPGHNFTMYAYYSLPDFMKGTPDLEIIRLCNSINRTGLIRCTFYRISGSERGVEFFYGVSFIYKLSVRDLNQYIMWFICGIDKIFDEFKERLN